MTREFIGISSCRQATRFLLHEVRHRLGWQTSPRQNLWQVVRSIRVRYLGSKKMNSADVRREEGQNPPAEHRAYEDVRV